MLTKVDNIKQKRRKDNFSSVIVHRCKILHSFPLFL